MATVTSFESLNCPSRSELRQFAELFAPLFSASTDEARRQAVAALAQNPNVPKPVALFIASQPIGIAAPFLIGSPCLDDETLILVARIQGEAHARTIVRRDDLSPTVIDALVSLRHARGAGRPQQPLPAETAMETPPTPARHGSRSEREEQLRAELRGLVRDMSRPAEDRRAARLGLRTLSTLQEALLVRFARTREAAQFATALSDALSASRWLAERIMLDISGKQLATTLVGTGMAATDAVFILERLYPHLGTREDAMSRAEVLVAGLDPDQCGERVEAWRRADSYTFPDARRGREAAADDVPVELQPLPAMRAGRRTYR